MPNVKCPYCKKIFDRDKVDTIYYNNRYYHTNCFEPYLKEHNYSQDKINELYKNNYRSIDILETAKKKKANIKICRYCGKEIDINKEEFTKVANRYAHTSCYQEQNADSEQACIDKIYEILKTSLPYKYNYVACERQREKYNKNGLSNEDILKTILYIKNVKKMSPVSATGTIGLIGYVAEEAKIYYNNLDKIKSQIEKDYNKHKAKVIQVHIDTRNEVLKKDYINLEELNDSD